MLLFDENLPARAVEILAEDFPESVHVGNAGLLEATDETIWDEARRRGLAILSKDDDFVARATLRGHPPKVIVLRVGNMKTRDLITFLRARREVIQRFLFESPDSILVLNL